MRTTDNTPHLLDVTKNVINFFYSNIRFVQPQYQEIDDSGMSKQLHGDDVTFHDTEQNTAGALYTHQTVFASKNLIQSSEFADNETNKREKQIMSEELGKVNCDTSGLSQKLQKIQEQVHYNIP